MSREKSIHRTCIKTRKIREILMTISIEEFQLKFSMTISFVIEIEEFQ